MAHRRPLLVAIFVAGTFLMRSAGCAVNDAADARFDAHVKRTADRVVARGLVSRREAMAVAAVLSVLRSAAVAVFEHRLLCSLRW